MKFLSSLGDWILSVGILSPGFPRSRDILFWFCSCSGVKGWLRSGNTRFLFNGNLPLGDGGGGFVPGGFVPGGFVPGGFVPRGFVPGGFVPRGFVPRGFVPGGFVPGGFVP